MPTSVRLIFYLFQILSKMLFDYQLDCENDFLLGSGKNARTNACKDVGNSLCHTFTLKDTDDETDMPKVLHGKVSSFWSSM